MIALKEMARCQHVYNQGMVRIMSSTKAAQDLMVGHYGVYK